MPLAARRPVHKDQSLSYDIKDIVEQASAQWRQPPPSARSSQPPHLAPCARKSHVFILVVMGMNTDTHTVTHRVASSYIRISRGTHWRPSHLVRNCFQHLNSWKYGPRKSVLPAVFTVSRDEKVAAKEKEGLPLNSVSPANHRHPFFSFFSLPREPRGSG